MELHVASTCSKLPADVEGKYFNHAQMTTLSVKIDPGWKERFTIEFFELTHIASVAQTHIWTDMLNQYTLSVVIESLWLSRNEGLSRPSCPVSYGPGI